MTPSIVQTLVLVVLVAIVLVAFWRWTASRTIQEAPRVRRPPFVSARPAPDDVALPEETPALSSVEGGVAPVIPQADAESPAPPAPEATEEEVPPAPSRDASASPAPAERAAPLIRADDQLAVDVIAAIQGGDVQQLRQLLDEHPDLARARLDYRDSIRTLLHIATDWPGHFPNGPATVVVLVAAGADVNAHMSGPHTETPLHWAASSDDVDVLDALIGAGAEIEASGSVIDGGPPLSDAVAFGQWRAARRLVEHGAQATLWHAAALGLMDRVVDHFSSETPPTTDEVTNAFWCACHGGQRQTAEYLLDRGAELNWVGHARLTPLDAAERSKADELADWLRGRGARSAGELA